MQNFSSLFQRLAISAILSIVVTISFSQPKPPVSGKDYVPNQVLIKIKDEFNLNVVAIQNNRTGVVELDNLLKTLKVNKVDNIFLPTTQKTATITTLSSGGITNNQSTTTKNKKENYLQLAIDNGSMDVLDLVEKLKVLPSVEFAEPNYIYSSDATMGKNPVALNLIQQKKVDNKIFLNTNSKLESIKWVTHKTLDFLPAPPVSPNDPMFSQQTNLTATNVPAAWGITTGDSTIIAVLDSGVDWLHPDLKDNIWINWKEFYGKPGVDDDGNGLVDDIRGWDYINNDNDPTDDHSHGTHVSGIIAAKGNNGIGISGVNWNAKIMCLKILQSTGRGEAATIAKAVDYAATMGAKIINLSLGGYYESLTFKTSLENAYAKCLILAASGNDGTCIGPDIGCAPFYPAAYSFVVGVQDQALYSNYDQDGPYISKYSNLLNYDTYAPGSSITSTVPGGAYTSYTGTSMATPLVAGIASLYMAVNKPYDKELLFSQLIKQQTNGFVDANKLLTVVPIPDLRVAKYEIVDTASNANNNGRPDAGENINLRIYLKNYSAKADSVSIKLSYENLADTSLVRFILDSCFVGSVSPNTLTFSQSPLNIKIANKVAHGADYKINVAIKDKKGNSWSDQIVITFQNAITLGGILTNNTVLYPDKYYYITDNLIINNCTLIIKPGTILNFSENKAIAATGSGKIIARGKADSLITFTSNSYWNGIKTSLLNSNFTNSNDVVSFCDTTTQNSVFKYCSLNNISDATGSSAKLQGGLYVRCVIKNFKVFCYYISQAYLFQCNILNNKIMGLSEAPIGMLNNQINNFMYRPDSPYLYENNSGIGNNSDKINVFNNTVYDLFSGWGNINPTKINPNVYFGTDDSLQIERQVLDYFDNPDYSVLLKQDFRKIPFDSCPGIVWKLTIDDKDFSSYAAKPEDIIEIGVHKLKIWFNRQMDTTITPIVSFGQRDPFNQVSITKKGIWAADRKSYTLSREFVLTDPNGIVNFNVSGAKDDMGMEIPYERTRFRINLQSSASKSLNFDLTKQCGKLYLNWDNLRTNGSDIIGYNLYRRKKTNNNIGSFNLLNTKLVTNNFYTDYKVNIDSTYDYLYRAVRAGLNNEIDSSYIISGQPLRSKLADANGDSAINVADVVTTVNKILQKDPVPFILQQTDMNADGVINVLDVIGIINRILNPITGGSLTGGYDYNSTLSAGKADLYITGDTLWTNSEVKIAGLEYTSSSIKKWISPIADWEQINLLTKIPNDKMTYAFDKYLEQKKNIPLAIVNTGLDIKNWIFSSNDGRPVTINWLGNLKTSVINTIEKVKISPIFPNPAKNQFTIVIENSMDINAVGLDLLDMMGRKVSTHNYGDFKEGVHNKNISTQHLSAGVYSVLIRWSENGSNQKQILRLVIE